MKTHILILTQLLSFVYLAESNDAEKQAWMKHKMRKIVNAIQTHSKIKNNQISDSGLHISWANCSAPGDPIVLKKVTLLPDPIVIPGNITLGFSADLKATIHSPIEVVVKMQVEKFGFWVTIPCEDNVGSCTYPDICSLLPNTTCPAEFQKHNIPCHCPFKQGSYTLPSYTIAVPNPGIPIFSAKVKVTALLMSGSQQLGCFQFQTDVK